MKFVATKDKVKNRGSAPDSFLSQLVTWAQGAPDELFAPNKVAVDIYTVIKPSLATVVGKDPTGIPMRQWDSLLHRKGAMLEVMRVHAGFESSWNWDEGVDTTNQSSMRNPEGQETGIFQVSFDSLRLGKGVMRQFAKDQGIDDVGSFIKKMKKDHELALNYYARLSRVSIAWAGPLLRHGSGSVYPYLSKYSMREFMSFL